MPPLVISNCIYLFYSQLAVPDPIISYIFMAIEHVGQCRLADLFEYASFSVFGQRSLWIVLFHVEEGRVYSCWLVFTLPVRDLGDNCIHRKHPVDTLV